MTKKGKKAHVNDDTFAELMKSAEKALAYERGERANCKVTQVSSKHTGTGSRGVTLVESTLNIQQEHKKPSNN